MIQRIQTVYLLLIVVLLTLSFFVMPVGVFGLKICAVISALVAFVTVFLYNKRKVQINLSVLNFVLFAAYFSLIFYYYTQQTLNLNADWKHKLLLLFPVIASIINILVIRAIGKDEALVKSLNRIR